MVAFAGFRALALGLPGAYEEATWETATFRVNKKIFAMGGPEGRRISVKASAEDQAELIAAEPETFAVAPYVGRFGWVSVALDTVDEAELRDLVTDAWRRTAPKKLVKEFDAA